MDDNANRVYTNRVKDFMWRGVFVLFVLGVGVVLALLFGQTSQGQIAGNAYGVYAIYGNSYGRVVTMTVGTPLPNPTRGIATDCTVAGTAQLKMSIDSSTQAVTLATGHTVWPFSILEVNSSTATCTYYGIW